MPSRRTIAPGLVLTGLLAGVMVAAATSQPAGQRGTQAIRDYTNPGTTVCGCNDVQALVQRLTMAQAAVDFLEAELAKMIRDKAADDLMYTKVPGDAKGRTNYQVLRDTIVEAQGDSQMWGASVSGAQTNAKCEPQLVAPTTPCMDEIVMRHERDIHVPRCQADLDAGKKAPVGENRAEMTIAAYANEERDSYASEVKTIRSILNSLPDLCRPSGWVGIIDAVERDTREANPPVTLSGTAKSRTENFVSDATREVRMLYREAPTTASTEASFSSTKTIRETHEFYCKPDRKEKTTATLTSVEKTNGAIVRQSSRPPVESVSNPSFVFDPETGKFQLSFELPDVTVETKYAKSDTVSGACESKDNDTKTTEATMPYVFSKDLVMLPGTQSPKTADMINVTLPVPLPPTPTDATFKRVYEIRVRLMLFKVR